MAVPLSSAFAHLNAFPPILSHISHLSQQLPNSDIKGITEFSPHIIFWLLFLPCTSSASALQSGLFLNKSAYFKNRVHSISSAGNVASPATENIWPKSRSGEIHHCSSTQPKTECRIWGSLCSNWCHLLTLPANTGVNKKWAGCTRAVFHWRKGTHTDAWKEPFLFDGHSVMDLLHLKQSFISTLVFKKQQPVVHTPVVCVIEFMTYHNVY